MRRKKQSAVIKELLLIYPKRIDSVRYDRHRELLWIVSADYCTEFLKDVVKFVRERLPNAKVEYTTEFVPMVLLWDVPEDPRPNLRNIKISARRLFDLE